MTIAMTVLRDGYFDGKYPRAGDTITVEGADLVEQLELAGFAMRQVAPAPVVPDRHPPKGSKHGR